MKKLHILIPSLAIASTLPVLTVVSCGNSWTSEWNINDGEFVWKHEQPTLHFETEELLTQGYFDRIDAKIFADDFMAESAESDWRSRDQIKSDIIKVRVNNIDKENRLLSFDFYNIQRIKHDVMTERDDVEGSISFKNMPFKLEKMGLNKNEWRISVDHATEADEHWVLDEWYTDNKQWSFTANLDFRGDRPDIKGTIDSNSISDPTKCQNIIDLMCDMKTLSRFFANADAGRNN